MKMRVFRPYFFFERNRERGGREGEGEGGGGLNILTVIRLVALIIKDKRVGVVFRVVLARG